MPKQVTAALSDRFVRTAAAGRYADGGGLYLIVKETGARSWLLRYRSDGGRVRDMGLGRAPGRKTDPAAVGLAEARDRAGKAQQLLKDGVDPLGERERLARAAAAQATIEAEDRTFGRVADDVFALVEKTSRNKKHIAGWKLSLKTYCKGIRAKAVDQVTREDVLDVLRPLSDRGETCARTRGRIERVLDAAKAKGWRTGENPAQWRGNLEHELLARPKLSRGHHRALPYSAVPGFVADLRAREAMAALALEFLILCASRTSEVRGARGAELDFAGKTWTIPGSRMKSGRPQRVALSGRALEIIALATAGRNLAPDDLIFPGPRKKGSLVDRPLSTNAFRALLLRMEVATTAHGFRASFKTWAEEVSSFPREVIEMALAHSVGDAAEQAYRRGDGLLKRAKLAEAWAGYIERGSQRIGSVTPIRPPIAHGVAHG
jgi:integrase